MVHGILIQTSLSFLFSYHYRHEQVKDPDNMVCPTSTVSSIFVVSNTNITSISDDLRRGKEGISEKDDDKGKA